MDVFGTVANALHLTHKVIRYTREVKGADEERWSLTSEVLSLQTLLLLVQDRATEAKKTPTDAFLSSVAALGVKDGPLDQCKASLESLATILLPQQIRLRRLLRKLEWPFKKGEMAGHIAKIERVKTLISLMFHTSLS